MIRIPKRQIGDALLWLMAATLLLWFGDWAVWRVKVRSGGGYDTVQVNQILLTPLKNHRIKADEQSTTDERCASALFPHGGDDPCWWLRRHSTEWRSAWLTRPGALDKAGHAPQGITPQTLNGVILSSELHPH